MKHIGLFEGIGGFSLAARWMGWNTIAWCEINQFCQKVLKYHFKEATPHEDITKTDFTIYRGKCDILTGGFPCQPYSVAGKQLGKEDERHLWPQMLRAIREIQPRWVVGENVRGLVSWNGGMVFHEVQADLEAEGYEVLPFLLPACAVNAPHRRDRIWFVAYASGNGGQKFGSGLGQTSESNRVKTQQQVFNANKSNGKTRTTSNTSIIGCNNGSDNWQERHIQRNIGVTSKDKSKWNGRQFRIMAISAVSSDTCNERIQGNKQCREDEGEDCKWGERVSGTTTELYTSSNWLNFPTQSPVCSRNDGFSYELDSITFPRWRAESIKAYGNAIVPQVAYQIFKAIEAYELTHNQNH